MKGIWSQKGFVKTRGREEKERDKGKGRKKETQRERTKERIKKQINTINSFYVISYQFLWRNLLKYYLT